MKRKESEEEVGRRFPKMSRGGFVQLGQLKNRNRWTELVVVICGVPNDRAIV